MTTGTDFSDMEHGGITIEVNGHDATVYDGSRFIGNVTDRTGRLGWTIGYVITPRGEKVARGAMFPTMRDALRWLLDLYGVDCPEWCGHGAGSACADTRAAIHAAERYAEDAYERHADYLASMDGYDY